MAKEIWLKEISEEDEEDAQVTERSSFLRALIVHGVPLVGTMSVAVAPGLSLLSLKSFVLALKTRQSLGFK